MEGTVASVNGVSLWHITQGEGVPLVLLHGGPGGYDYMEPVADLLDNRRYRTIRYDQRGSWRSERKGPYTVETFIEDLEQLRAHLRLVRWVVCGHSWGASLALVYTVKYPSRVKALIYMSGTGINPAWHADYRVNRLIRMGADERERYAGLRAIVDTLEGEAKEETRIRIRELSLRTVVVKQDQYDRLPRMVEPFVNDEVNRTVGSDSNRYLENEAFQSKVATITSPSLFLHGDADPRPYRYVNELADRVPGGEFRLISDAGHYPWLDNPTALGEHLNDFLARKV